MTATKAKTFPVLYDLDANGEATGTVHYFCCGGCRSQSPHKWPDTSNYGLDAEAIPGTVCELCHKELVPPTGTREVTVYAVVKLTVRLDGSGFLLGDKKAVADYVLQQARYDFTLEEDGVRIVDNEWNDCETVNPL